MGSQWTSDRFLNEQTAVEPAESWMEDASAEDEKLATPKDRRNKYVARRSIERYWELKALRSHLDEFDTVEGEF
jgi:hypothetical protein